MPTRGRIAAIHFSLNATCKHLGIDPFAYLRDLLTDFPSISNPTAEQLHHWLPDAWKQSNAKTETRSSKE